MRSDATIREAALALVRARGECNGDTRLEALAPEFAALRSALDAAPSWSGLAEVMEAEARLNRDNGKFLRDGGHEDKAGNCADVASTLNRCARMVREAGLRESAAGELLAACEAAEDVLKRASFDHLCDAMHHEKKDRHGAADFPGALSCPIATRARQALDSLRAAIAKARGDKP